MLAHRPYVAARGWGLVFWVGILLMPVPAHALDPMTMFLLGFARNLLESALEENKSRPAPPVALPAPLPKPATNLKQADLRTLIDESFAYLTSAQRAELLASLEQALADPANAAHRDAILSEFVSVAHQVQVTHTQLNRLSAEEKQRVANRFAANFRNLDEVQQQDLLERLRLRALPVPADLNDMMLSALAPRTVPAR